MENCEELLNITRYFGPRPLHKLVWCLVRWFLCRQPVFPASYDLDNVVSVAAISRNGQLAPFSSYGKKQVDVAAPGANIMTTSARRSYRSVSGTSFAVPMVTGTLALLWTRLPQLNYRQVIQRMLRSVKKNPQLEGMPKMTYFLQNRSFPTEIL